MPDDYEIPVDFVDMSTDGRLWVRAIDARPGLELAVGRHVVVGDEHADPRVARTVDTDQDIELEVLPGSVESHAHPLTSA